ncbi:citryl-CoA lyase [Candidatus Daviesbacteria bacterium]|nr:citryl-CoA lyase [Candidatus Daviesbacteria bacterium]
MARTITHQDNDESKPALFGEENHLEISQQRSFASLIFELLSEKTPSKQEEKIFELILNLSIDHGPNSPSGVATVNAAKDGKTLSEAIAAGILQINESHGGAIEPCMEILYKIRNTKYEIGNLVEEYLKEGKRMPGFGHRVYKEADPRTQLIFKKLEEAGLGGEFIKVAKDLEAELKAQKGITLPANIDAAIAVVLCSFGWEAKLANAVFIIARTPGLCAHYLNNTASPISSP